MQNLVTLIQNFKIILDIYCRSKNLTICHAYFINVIGNKNVQTLLYEVFKELFNY